MGALQVKSRSLLAVVIALGFFLSGTNPAVSLRDGSVLNVLSPGVAFGSHVAAELEMTLKPRPAPKDIDLGQSFINAFETNDETMMRDLVKENKSSVPNELFNMINYATSGEVNTAEMEWIIRVSEKMGEIYRAEFSDMRLEKFVSNYKKWSKNEQKKKKEADEIFYSSIKEMKNRNYDAVVDKWDTSLEIYKEIGDKLGEVNRLDEIGITFGRLGSFETSIRILNDARMIHKEIGNVLGEVNNLRYVATGYLALQDYDHAIESYKSALAIVLENGDVSQRRTIENEILGIESKMKSAMAEIK